MRAFAMLALLTLAACGADGDPIRPEPRVQTQVGVSVGSDGLRVSRQTTVSTQRGPVSVGVTF